ncbi:unnamed protein product, partial [Polarella glacialis]
VSQKPALVRLGTSTSKESSWVPELEIHSASDLSAAVQIHALPDGSGVLALEAHGRLHFQGLTTGSSRRHVKPAQLPLAKKRRWVGLCSPAPGELLLVQDLPETRQRESSTLLWRTRLPWQMSLEALAS